MVWDGIVACDLFCAGLGAWTYLFALIAGGWDERARQTKLVAAIVALVAVGLGALILAVDAKGGFLNPVRYLHLLGNLGSVMAWGVILISLFLVCAFVCVVLMLMKRGVPRVLEIVAGVFALGVSVYTGVLLGSAPAFPLWNPIALPLAFVVSAAYTGYAAFCLIARFAKGEDVVARWLPKAGVVLPLVFAVTLVLLVVLVSGTQGSGAEAAAASLANLFGGSNAVPFWGGVVVVGLALPLVLALVRIKAGEKAAAWMGVLEWACILVGGFAFRYVVVMAAVPLFG